MDRKSTVLLHFLSDLHTDYKVLQYHILILSTWTIKFHYVMSIVLAVMKYLFRECSEVSRNFFRDDGYGNLITTG